MDQPILRRRPDDAALAVTEVVTNAVRHGGVRDGVDELLVLVDGTDDRVRVTVEQPTAADGVAIVEPWVEHGNPGGFGLRLVNELTDQWGHDPGPPGKVWFELR